jgi:Uma2 family endonuclease
MQVALPEYGLPVKILLNPERGLSDEEFYDFCVENPDLNIERTEQGVIVIVPPAGFESSFRSLEVSAQLRQWAKRDGRGRAFDSSAMFLLPRGAGLSPDAAWVSKKQLSLLSREQLKKFVPLAPEFVVEVMSPSDRLGRMKRKMEEWIANGVPLAWLIDGETKSVFIYRPGVAVEERRNITELDGEAPVKGFRLDLGDIWEGL